MPKEQHPYDGWDEEPTGEFRALTARVLVAEDDPELRDLVAARLRREGCEVIAVGSGGEALDIITACAELPQLGLELAILDVRMPGMSGLEVVHSLRTGEVAMPILLVTAFPDPDLLAECGQLGVPVLKKPFALHRIGPAARAAMRGGSDPGAEVPS